jgi:tetratricopeptide (TPR) repeat protein/tRNA A-37 threonylcarbamoyl transferase component Bud32
VADESRGSRASEGGQIPAGALSALLVELAQSPPQAGSEAEVAAFAPGTRFGRFEIVRELGRGGFGVVYEALDRDLGRRVAFKVVRAGRGSPGLREERLLREAEAAARLSHPNLVTLHDVGRSDEGPFLVLELLHGRTLAERLDEGPVTLAEALEVAVQVARGLAWAHAHGVIHRDLKPANVFLCEGGLVKILDFGLAHAFGQTRVDGGTPAYMAPEQWASAPEDERTDVYALGVMLYRMLAGEVPFPSASSGKAVLAAHAPPRLDVPGLPALGDLATRMLSRDPVERPRDGKEVLAALEGLKEALRDASPPPPPSSTGSHAARVRRRRPGRWVALGVLAAIAGGGGAALLLQARSPSPPGRPIVAVADARNGTGDPDLDGVSGLLVTSLEQSRLLGVLTRARMLALAEQAGHGKVASIDEAVGIDVVRKAGATALLVANVHRLGSTYAVELRAIDPRRDSYLFTLRDQSPSKEGIIPLIDRMGDRVRRELNEPAAEVADRKARLQQQVTGNLEAYRHYFQARQLQDRIRLEEAVAELERALDVDPEFALAHYELSRMGSAGEITEARRLEHEQAALRMQDRLPPRQRALLLAKSAEAAGRSAEAETRYRELAFDAPDEQSVLLDLGAMLLDQERPAEAAPFLERALQLSPTDEIVMAYLLRSLGFLGRTDDLLAAARRAAEAAPGPETALLAAEAALWAGDLDGTVREARRAIELGEHQARGTLAVAGLRRGEPALAAEAFPPDRPAPLHQAAVHLFLGRRRAAEAALAAAPPGSPMRIHAGLAVRAGLEPSAAASAESERLAQAGAQTVGPVAAALAWGGNAADAARLASLLPATSPDAALYRAVAAWRAGRPEEALPTLRELSASHASGPSFLDSLFLGEVALEAGRADEAADALRRFQRMSPSLFWSSWAYPRSLLLLARAEEARGRVGEARELADRLARLWADADPDFPPLLELRALRERLGG